MGVFERYAPFVQDFIYEHSWESLRAIQVAAGEAIFDTEENVLLCASTASGKTEAAFFPILTLFDEDPPASVGAIYIGPLKALINDQFMRLNDLCEQAHIPVWHWHGDVAQSHKARMLKQPSGILQITPESLEALLLHKHAAVARLFGDLRFIVIDEVHSLLRGDRGGQTLCLIERLSQMAGVNPRRIGLSATIGDPELTGTILSAGSGRGCVIPQIQEQGRTWRLSMEHFFVQGPQAYQTKTGPRTHIVDDQASDGRREGAALTARQAAGRELDGAQGAGAPARPRGADTPVSIDGFARADANGAAPWREDVTAAAVGAPAWSCAGEVAGEPQEPAGDYDVVGVAQVAALDVRVDDPDGFPARAAADAQGGACDDRRRAGEARGGDSPDTDPGCAGHGASNAGCDADNGLGQGLVGAGCDVGDGGGPVHAGAVSDAAHVPLAGASDVAPEFADPGIGYIFEHTRDKKCLVFVNSREECETVCTTLRQYCEANGEPDRFLIHHGNLSASYRETAEEAMRDDERSMTTVTTATLELGIDIGRLERAFQVDAPFTVSSFLQRMGRTGRRGQPPEMWFVMREDPPEARAMLPESVPWKLIQGIALVQLYVEERWVEPPRPRRLPYSLLYHQTMATLASCGELSPAALAQRVLTLSPFEHITTQDYRTLLNHLIETDHIERTEGGGLIVGLAGERLTNSFKFYAVFQENEEYTVRSESQELGTIVMPPPVGERIALAGHVWVVEEIDHKRHLIYATQVKGKVPAYFGDCPGDINTHVLERMRRVLREDLVPAYLMRNAVARLEQARHVATNSDVVDEPLVCLGGDMWCLFPWLGSYAFLALERFLKVRCAPRLGLRGLDASRPYFMQFKMARDVDEATFFRVLAEEIAKPLDPMELVYPDEVPYFEKYDSFVPAELVRKGFACGVLDIDGMRERVEGWAAERVGAATSARPILAGNSSDL